MKKKIKLFFAAAIVSVSSVVAPVVSLPDHVMAKEVSSTDTAGQSYSINTETKYRICGGYGNQGSEEPVEGEKYGYITADRSMARSGEKVTVKAVSGTDFEFGRRYAITRVSDGADVTEELLGERIHHKAAGETFTMPSYDITISGTMADYALGTPPVPAIEGTDDYYPVDILQSEGGTVSITGGVEQFGSITGASCSNSGNIVVKAVPESGYRFVKWYVYSYEHGLGATDDLLVRSDTNKTDGSGLRYAEAAFKMKYGGLRISAVFVKKTESGFFADVTDKKAYYYKAVNWAAEKGIVSESKDLFYPNRNCTREQAITMLWRLVGKPNPGALINDFSDFKNTNGYSGKAISWGVEKGLIRVDNGKIKPAATCTREQAVTMLWRMAGKPEPGNNASKFTDVTDKRSYSYKAVLWANEKGIAKGSGGKFFPNAGCKRKDIVTFIYRYANLT